MRIFAGHDGGSGCAYFRMQLPLLELGRHGHEVTYADAGDRDGPPSVTLSMLQGYDVIVAQRWNTHKGLEVWRRARTPQSRLVYDLDDDLWHITPENWAAYNLYGKPEVRDAVEHAIEVADLVTCSTEPLAAVLREFNPNVTVLPNHVPGWVLDLPRETGDRPRIGWAGAASHGVDIGLIADPVRRFLKRFGDWDFQVHGTDYRPTIKGGPSARRDLDSRMTFRPWVQVNQHPEAYYRSLDFDVGLCPVYRTTFSDSKSAIKALEYAARGIPSVCSDVPAYRPFVRHGETGFLVKRDHEWLRYMSELASDAALREKMGQAAREAARQYMIEDGYKLWERAYQQLFR